MSQIEFFEDPFSFQPLEWERIQNEYSIKLANDREAYQSLEYPNSAEVCVIKPAIQDIRPFLKSKKQLVITTYLDHPLGILNAAYVAAQTLSYVPKQLLTCGLLSYSTYKPDSFSQQLNREGTSLKPPIGTGFGFDDLLENLPWQKTPY